MTQGGATGGAVLPAAHPLLALADSSAGATADRLHDGAVQALVAARYAADAAVRGGDPVQARDAVQEALVQLRAALWHLRPRTSTEGSFAGALDLLQKQLAAEGRGALTVDLADAPLSASVSALAYRLVQTVALDPDTADLSVVLRRQDGDLVLDVTGGAALPDLELWAAAAEQLGAALTTDGSAVRLRVPAPDDSTKEAR